MTIDINTNFQTKKNINNFLSSYADYIIRPMNFVVFSVLFYSNFIISFLILVLGIIINIIKNTKSFQKVKILGNLIRILIILLFLCILITILVYRYYRPKENKNYDLPEWCVD